MITVLITALGVGGATLIGAAIGFLFKNVNQKASDGILSFAAGIMLAASVIGLIIPSIELGGKFAVLITVVGIFVGAICLSLMDKLIPHTHKFIGIDAEKHKNGNINKILLFVLAIAIHNLPEGIAAGVSFGAGNQTHALVIAGGIALQNIPEGIVIIAPMLSVGIKKGKTFLIAAFTGLVEVIGTFLGYFAVNLATVALPFALAFAGGSMLYVIGDEMIPETHSHGNQRLSTYMLLLGFCVMLAVDFLLG